MKTFNVFGLKYKLKLIDLSNTGSKAICFHDKQTIFIHNGGKKEDFTATLIHELGHAMFHAISLHQTSISADLEEIIVENFSKVMTQNFDIKLKK